MSFVGRGENGASQPFDITVDVGTGTDRVAVIHAIHRDSSGIGTWPTPFASVTRDPGGADQSGTFVSGASVEADNSGDGGVRNYHHVWYMDLADGLSGTQTFRIDATDGDSVAIAEVVVYDDFATGGPEASNATEYVAGENAGAHSSSITGSITPVSNNATLISLVQGYDRDANVGPEDAFFSPDDGQTERGDYTPGNNYAVASGDLVVATGGSPQSLGWTTAGPLDVWMNGMLAFAPAASGSSVTIGQATETDSALSAFANVENIVTAGLASETDSALIASVRASDKQYQTLSGYVPNNGDDLNLADNFSGAQDGDELEVDLVTNRGASITVNADGTIVINGTGYHDFVYRIRDNSDNTWSSYVTVEVNALDPISIGISSETDSAFSTIAQIGTGDIISPALETDSAFAFVLNVTVHISQASSTEAGRQFVPVLAPLVQIGLASEANVGFSFVPSVGPEPSEFIAEETDIALPLEFRGWQREAAISDVWIKESGL